MDSREKDNTYEGSLAQQLGIKEARVLELDEIIVKTLFATDEPATFIKRILTRHSQVLDARETAYIFWITAENQEYYLAQAVSNMSEEELKNYA